MNSWGTFTIFRPNHKERFNLIGSSSISLKTFVKLVIWISLSILNSDKRKKSVKLKLKLDFCHWNILNRTHWRVTHFFTWRVNRDPYKPSKARCWPDWPINPLAMTPCLSQLVVHSWGTAHAHTHARTDARGEYINALIPTAQRAGFRTKTRTPQWSR